MKLSLGLPAPISISDSELFTAPSMVTIAQRAEELGFDAVYATDHPAPTSKWLKRGGHLGLDPFVALSIAAAVTTTLRLHTNLLVLPYRNPFLAAKSVSSLDVASQGRAIIGVGSGYLEGEFRALGVGFDDRNDRSDEALRMMTQAWSGTPVQHEGSDFSADDTVVLPATPQQPRPPLWIGGNSKRAIRRAIELGDGWAPMGSPAGSEVYLHTPPISGAASLGDRIGYAREHAAAVGRTEPLDIVFAAQQLSKFATSGITADAIAEEAAALAAVGVTWLTVELPGETLAEFLPNIERFGTDILPALRSL